MMLVQLTSRLLNDNDRIYEYVYLSVESCVGDLAGRIRKESCGCERDSISFVHKEITSP